MKKKARNTTRGSKTPSNTKKSKKKTTKVSVKKKSKSYYKPKKVREYEEILANSLKKPRKNPKIESALISPQNIKDVEIIEIDVPVVEKGSKRPVKYLNNKDLLAQVILSKKQGKMTNELAKMLQLLTLRYGKKGNWVNYTYNNDMQSYAMLMIVKTWQGFDPNKSSNPFAWFTQCIKNSFIQFLNLEKRQRDIRDEVLIDSGMNPSYGYTYDYENQSNQEIQEYDSNDLNDSSDSNDSETIEVPTKMIEHQPTFIDEEVPTLNE